MAEKSQINEKGLDAVNDEKNIQEWFHKFKKTVGDIIMEEVEKPKEFKSDSIIDTIRTIMEGTITLIAAPMKAGKSFTLLHMALVHALAGNRVLYISLENDYKAYDKFRIEDALSEYKQIPDTFDYINKEFIPYSSKPEEKDRPLRYVLGMIAYLEDYDIIFIDAPEKIMDGGDSGAEISRKGKEFFERILISMKQNKNRVAVVMTWQFNKDSIKEGKMNLASLGGSISAAQSVDTIWTVYVKDDGTRKVKCLASRGRVGDNPEFTIYEKGRFKIPRDTSIDSLINLSK